MATETDKALAVIGWKAVGILGVPILGLVFMAGTFANRLSTVERDVGTIQSLPKALQDLALGLERVKTILERKDDELDKRVKAEVERIVNGR